MEVVLRLSTHFCARLVLTPEKSSSFSVSRNISIRDGLVAAQNPAVAERLKYLEDLRQSLEDEWSVVDTPKGGHQSISVGQNKRERKTQVTRERTAHKS